ncbi:cation transporter, partial [Helicobacter rodentium]|uniref:cation transporter n=1 Tax=Helicobacter rodentium TaxID=59617 RepID=UPI003F657601
MRQNFLQPLQTAQPLLANNQWEQFVLKISMYSALLLAILGIGFGLSFKSAAIVFDGIIALISVGLGLLSVITSRFVYREDDDVFQYGYVRFEPMVNLFKSLILIIVCAYALIGGFDDILSGGYTLQINGAMAYTICAFLLCFVIFIYT